MTFADAFILFVSDIAAVMVKMVEEKEYEGGTCVLKTPYEERIEEEGFTRMVQKMKEYDPSPRYVDFGLFLLVGGDMWC
jgi:hypothetical protein